MGCHKAKDEVIVCNTLFKYDLVEVSDGVYDLLATPCNLPTAVFNVGRITVRENACNQMEYFQGFINTDPVEIIQDCDLERLIQRMIRSYVDDIPEFSCNSNGNNCRRSGFGLF